VRLLRRRRRRGRDSQGLTLDERIASGDIMLAAHLALPRRRNSVRPPAVVICHGYPTTLAAARAADTQSELAERIATEMGWAALAFAFRGCGESTGQFSIAGWLDDVLAAVNFVDEEADPSGIWVVGFGTGGAVAICGGARDQRVRGVAAVGTPGDFDDWESHPRRLLEHCREVGLITDPAYPPSLDAWARELRSIRGVACVRGLAPRPLLVIHGSEDEVVPSFDARVLADAHGSAELRFINGAGHALRHDPRAVAVLLGWLDRQRHAVAR
jgi:pimeloyl-ACP methyl ester carboxylesterase